MLERCRGISAVKAADGGGRDRRVGGRCCFSVVFFDARLDGRFSGSTHIASLTSHEIRRPNIAHPFAHPVTTIWRATETLWHSNTGSSDGQQLSKLRKLRFFLLHHGHHRHGHVVRLEERRVERGHVAKALFDAVQIQPDVHRWSVKDST